MNNITIYDIPKFLSLYIIPSFLFLYLYYPNTRSSLFIHGFIITIIGCLDIYYRKNLHLFLKVITYIVHIVIIIPILLFPQFNISYSSILLLWCAIFLILFLPWWPYAIKRKSMLNLYLLLFSLFTLMINLFLHPFHYNNNSH